jgi:hypothetical protein
MPLTEEERRRCCILGGCGCGPPEQRAAMREWLLENFAPPHQNEQNAETYVDALLDDLFQDVKCDEDGKVIASTSGAFILGDEPLEVDLDLKQQEEEF